MAQSGYTPILIYASGTAAALPSAANLTSSANGAELALNYADGKLYYKNSSGVVTLLASAAAASGTSPGGSNTQVQYNNAGAFAGSSNLTFDGTSLTLGGNPTLSGGTANGVLYLNGSKVATSGSALTFDGSSSLVVSTSASNGVISVVGPSSGTSNGAYFSIINGATTTSSIGNYSRIIGGAYNESLAFYNNGNDFVWYSTSERMRLTSTGLGIGTSSPAYKLDVVSSAATWAARVYNNNANNGLLVSTSSTSSSIGSFGCFNGVAYTFFVRDDGNVGIGTSSPNQKLEVSGNIQVTATNKVIFNDGGGTDCFIGRSGAQTLVLGTGGSERMRLDSSGNLGLGVTPTTGGYGKGFQLSSDSANDLMTLWSQPINTNDHRLSLANNAKNTGVGTWAYFASSQSATMYEQVAGVHRWFTAGTGTAGNAITFTQAMTLDASGNLGIGTSSPAAKLDVLGQAMFQGSTLPNQKGALIGAVNINNNSADGVVDFTQGIVFTDNVGGGTAWAHAGIVASGSSGYSGNLVFGTDGGSTSAQEITERARITSGGNLLVGTTSQPVGGITARLAVSQSAADYSAIFVSSQTTAANCYGARIQYTGAAPNGTSNAFLVMTDTGGDRAYFRSNGGLSNYQANDTNLSDRREKTNLAPAKSYLDIICAIPVQTFNYIDQSEDDPGLTLGVVAQDVQAVAPELVMESNWGTEENPKMRLSIYQTDLQYALMKCIQEQQALITSLTARVALLEGN